MPYTPTYYYDGGGGGGGSITPEPAPSPTTTKNEPGIADPEIYFTNTAFANYYVYLNDLKGGSATVSLYRKEGGSFVPCSNPDSINSYSGEDTDTWSGTIAGAGTTTDSTFGTWETYKVMIDYTYPDGETGHYESAEVTGYNGGWYDRDRRKIDYDPVENAIYLRYVIDPSLTDIVYSLAYLWYTPPGGTYPTDSVNLAESDPSSFSYVFSTPTDGDEKYLDVTIFLSTTPVSGSDFTPIINGTITRGGTTVHKSTGGAVGVVIP